MNNKPFLTFAMEVSRARAELRAQLTRSRVRVDQTLDAIAPLDGRQDIRLMQPLRQLIIDTLERRRPLWDQEGIDKMAGHLAVSGHIHSDPQLFAWFELADSTRSKREIKKLGALVGELKDHIDGLSYDASQLIDSHMKKRAFSVGIKRVNIDVTNAHALDFLHGALDLVAGSVQRAKEHLLENPTDRAPSPRVMAISVVAYFVFFALRGRPTRHWRKSVKSETSPFLTFLGRVLSIHGEHCDPARPAKYIIKYMRDRMPARDAALGMDKKAS